MSEWWSGSTLSIYIKKDEYDKYYGKEHGYLLMNHSYEIDWLMGWHFCDSIKVLGVSIIALIFVWHLIINIDNYATCTTHIVIVFVNMK